MTQPTNNPSKNQPVTPPLLLVIRSPRWQSQIQRWLEGLDLAISVHWLLSFEDAQTMSLSHPSAAIVLEISEDFAADPAAALLGVARRCNNPQNCPLFLLGDATAESWAAAFYDAGAIDVCTSVLGFEDFGMRIKRHLENHVRTELTVEQKVVARLPW